MSANTSAWTAAPNLMQVHLKALDDDGKLSFEGSVQVDALKLMVLAESKEELTRSKGQAFTEGAVPFWAAELVTAAKDGHSTDELDRLSLNVAMSAWLAASLYGGVSSDDFVRSNLHFTLLPNGAVKFDRIKR